MKIKRPKYILWILIWIFVFSFWKFLLAWCIELDGSPHWAWTDPNNPTSCQSSASPGTNERFNNNRPTNNSELDRFLLIIDKSWPANCSSSNWYNASSIRAIQSQMQAIQDDHCSTCIDGKYWLRTQTAISACLASDKLCPSPNKKPTLNNWVLTCEQWYKTGNVGGFICCEKEPEITISDPNIEQTSWEWNTLEVDVSYEIEWTGNITTNCTTDKFIIAWWTLNQTNQVGTNPKCHLKINSESNNVTVQANSWVIVWGSKESPSWSKSFSKPESCQNPPISWSNPPDCSNQFWWRWVYSGAINCCVEGDSCANQPVSPWQCSWTLVLNPAGDCCITCEHPVNWSWNCTEPWFTAQGNCCFANNLCWSWVNMWWQCHECTWDTIANENHTKCICNSNIKCCWIQLNTVVPFIWDCIELNTDSHRWDTTVVTSVTAFPILMQWLMKILMSAIMVFSFLMVIVAWLMMTTWAFSNSSFSKWKTILKNVIISLILLWCSWLILSLINPSFFGG